MKADTNATLGALVTQDPRRARVLEKHELDYCCNGQRTLAEAAAAAGLDAEQVAATLDLPEAPAAPDAPGSVPLANATLAHEIVDTHHAYLWEEMPRLQALVAKVQGVHGQNHPELTRVREAYEEAVADLEPHLTKEERVLFPAISKLEKAQAPVAFPFGTLANPIRQMLAEHDVVGDLFKEIRQLTGGYTAPDDACNSYRAMLTGLEEMELDLHEHIHKENNILFPRVLELEASLRA
ncbi:regulator of cell morphogenesis and NO signaling [Luteococcus japonicus]|uniref:Regulator of cell morphogenesis and NO signaling n=1 Tax=Luteococcus japonicus TaxID=33984 RepID=A0A3N1ZT81_9ACTN|nr:iron-sulfur cluster repair di-iron protein [Luteococcus japonicus]ROR54083.1 regulator of cell morphogenesis and NO signaling [Luteococcus japonicus]